MPRPATPTLAPYTEQLPDVNSPSTWATRTPLFWNWVTGPGYDNFTNLLGYSESAIDFIDAALAGSESIVDAVAALQAEMVGMIVMWSGSVASIPSGWALCNGANGTPDLRDRFIVGAGSTYATGATGGANTVALTAAQMPSHTHSVNINTNSAGNHAHNLFHGVRVADQGGFGGSFNGSPIAAPSAGGVTVNQTRGDMVQADGTHAHNVSGATASAGSGAAHENRPPYYALAYIMKL